MGREDLMRISRALALFRPSFIALIMNLTEEDLVFMEKCLQRTLLVHIRIHLVFATLTMHLINLHQQPCRNMKNS